MANSLGALRPVRFGILLSVLAIGFGFSLGGLFGVFEDQIKGSLSADAEAVRDEIYQGDAAAMKAVTSKSWSYFKRAHLHGGAIGAAVLALCLMLSAFERSAPRTRGLTAGALGVGALGYPVFWLLAAQRAPALGSTGAAKESLTWLSVPTAGLALVGLAAALVLLVLELFATRRENS